MDMGAIMAALILAVIPVVVFYLACQKHIIKGVAAGAVTLIFRTDNPDRAREVIILNNLSFVAEKDLSTLI